jgi:DHA2 family multidrug resistance protein-like MFS transporter
MATGRRHSRASVAAVLLAMAMVVLDAGMVNVALPSIAASLEVTPAISVRIVLAYQTALVIALLPAAALAESVGYQRIFSAGIVLFIAASLLCVVAPSLEWLIAMRFVQGLGGAAIMALGIALLRQSLSPARLGAAIGWNALTVATGSAAGPMIEP